MSSPVAKAAIYVARNWERFLFAAVGIACLILTFGFLLNDQVAAGSALFGMSFFSFFYANLARFKRFKGLGFEAELWEDKQREAAGLINRLKGLVSSYTREIVMGIVMRGRWSDGIDWTERWALFDDLTGKHRELGQHIDFGDLKQEVDRVFAFDICNPLADAARQSLEAAKQQAGQLISQKYGSPITDAEGHSRDIATLGLAAFEFGDLFNRSKTENIATHILSTCERVAGVLAASFGVQVDMKPIVRERLKFMAQLIGGGPIHVTPELIDWANWRPDKY